MYNPILVFDIETKIDIHSGRILYDFELNDEDSEQALIKLRRQETGQDFQRLALHEIVCISGFWFNEGDIKLFSWTQEQYSEAEIIQKFFKIFYKYKQHSPRIVTWNGSQFDLPVLMIRSMLHGLSSAYLWDNGELFSQKRYQNYVNRYHHQHIDLMDQLAMFHQKHFAKLDDMAHFFGLAGKPELDLNGAIKQQNWSIVRQYCESDVLNTWLIYLRWSLLKGQLDGESHDNMVHETLAYLQEQAHCQNFIERWQHYAQKNVFSQRFFI